MSNLRHPPVSPRTVAVVLAAMIGLAACDKLLVPPAPAAARLAIHSSVLSAGHASPGSAFDAADNALVTVSVPGRAPVERSFSFPAGQQEIRLQVELSVEAATAPAAISVQLRRGPDPLFTGSANAVVRQGATVAAEVALAPVAARITTSPSVTLTALNRPVQLQAVVLFATGDTVSNAPLQWSSDTTDLVVTPSGMLTARQNGTYTVRVRSDSASAALSVVVASPPASIAFSTPADPGAFPGDPYPVSPVAVVRDSAGFALRGVTVAFAADNDGRVSHTSVVTDAEGRATLPTWSMGRVGANRLTASLPGVTPAVLTVPALNPCEKVRPVALGGSVSGRIASGYNCGGTSQMWDEYSLVLSAPTILSVDVSSANLSPAFFLFDGAQQIMGRAGTAPETLLSEQLLPAGEYRLRAATAQANLLPPEGGTYTMTLRQVTEPQTACNRFSAGLATTYVVDGAVAQGRITPADCADTVAEDAGVVTRRFDGYTLLTPFNVESTVTVTVTADFPYRFTMWAGNNGGTSHVQGQLGVPAGETRSITFQSNIGGFRTFFILADQHEGGGNYTMTFSIR